MKYQKWDQMSKVEKHNAILGALAQTDLKGITKFDLLNMISYLHQVNKIKMEDYKNER